MHYVTISQQLNVLAHCTVLCLFSHFIRCIGREAKIKFCLTPTVVMRKLSEWNSFVIRIDFFPSLPQNTMFDTHSTLSKNFNNYTEHISITNFSMGKWDYVQSLGEAKDKIRKIGNICIRIRASVIYNATHS